MSFDDGVKILQTVPPSVRTIWKLEKEPDNTNSGGRTIGVIDGPKFTIKNNDLYLNVKNNQTLLSNEKTLWTMVKDSNLSVSPVEAGNYRLSLTVNTQSLTRREICISRKLNHNWLDFLPYYLPETGIGVRIENRKTCKHLCDVNPICQSYIYTNENGCVLSTNTQIPTNSMISNLPSGPLKGMQTVTGIKLGSRVTKPQIDKKNIQILNIKYQEPLNIENNIRWDIIPCKYHTNLYTLRVQNKCLSKHLDMRNPSDFQGKDPIEWIASNADILWYISSLDLRQQIYSLIPFSSKEYLGMKDSNLLFKKKCIYRLYLEYKLN